jgi:signal transduction histidine kinase
MARITLLAASMKPTYAAFPRPYRCARPSHGREAAAMIHPRPHLTHLLPRLFGDSVLPCAVAALALVAALTVQHVRVLQQDAGSAMRAPLEQLAAALEAGDRHATQATLDQALQHAQPLHWRRIEWQRADGGLLHSGTDPEPSSMQVYRRELTSVDGLSPWLAVHADARPLQQAIRITWLLGTLCAAGVAILALLGRWALQRQVILPLARLQTTLDELLVQGASTAATAPDANAEFECLRTSTNQLVQLLAAHRMNGESVQHADAGDVLDHLRQGQAAIRIKSHFMAQVGHHFRQPLQALQLFTASLGPGLDADQQALLAQMRGSVGAMTRLLDALLEISRLDAGVISAAPIHFSAAELFLRVRLELDSPFRRRDVRLVWHGACHHLYGDAELAGQLLRQLIDNAIVSASPDGRVLIAARRQGDQVHVEVRDNGAGIAPIHQQRIFEEFVQLPAAEGDRHDGYGLGLAIASRLAQLLGTHIDLRSAPERGSMFGFSLPRMPTRVHSEPLHRARQPPAWRDAS